MRNEFLRQVYFEITSSLRLSWCNQGPNTLVFKRSLADSVLFLSVEETIFLLVISKLHLTPAVHLPMRKCRGDKAWKVFLIHCQNDLFGSFFVCKWKKALIRPQDFVPHSVYNMIFLRCDLYKSFHLYPAWCTGPGCLKTKWRYIAWICLLLPPCSA